MGGYKLWYDDRRYSPQYLRDNERDLIHHVMFDYNMYIKALEIASEKIPDNHMCITMNIPLFKGTTKVCDADELPESDTLAYIVMEFIRSSDEVYLCDVHE